MAQDKDPWEDGYSVGSWLVSPRSGELRQGEETVHLRPKVAALLTYLAKNAGEVCERDALLRAVWGDRAVSDEPLSRSIAELRTCLGDSGTEQQFVQTLPKRGYRLIAPVALPSTTESSAPSAGMEEFPASRAAELEKLGFEVLQDLGAHSKMCVLIARDRTLGRRVVVKYLKPALAEDRVAQARFHREAKAAALIDHERVATIYQVASFRDGTPFLVEQYLEGESLSQVLLVEAPLAADALASIALDLAAALNAIHTAGIVHRDLHPGNIRSGADGHYRVTDFVLATDPVGDPNSARLTAAGEFVGHRAFTSPEQVRGDTATDKADVYVFGLLLYHLATGESPYAGIAEAVPGAAHVTADPTPLPDQLELPPSLKRAIELSLQKSPEHRPNAGQLLNLLNAPATQDLTAWQPATLPRILGGLALLVFLLFLSFLL